MSERTYHTFNISMLAKKGCTLTKAAFLGKSYTVVPVSMIVSGAYIPGGGDEPQALFFDGSDLEKSKDTWNGRPASLGHPTNGVTMNNPDSFNDRWLGFVFNTKYEKKHNRLSAQLWLEDTRSDDIINKVSSGEEIDVSIGAFGNVVKSEGESNGVKYFYKFTDIRGDHLAVLPESTGACSWSDGCGIRAESGIVMILATARTPHYSGTETTSWEDVDKSLESFVKAYYKSKGGSVPEGSSDVSGLSKQVKSWIAAKTLLGDPNADNRRDLMMFPVVNPNTGKLNAGALRAVMGSRGQGANIPSGAKKSAIDKATSLYNKHFKKEESESSSEGKRMEENKCVEEKVEEIKAFSADDIVKNPDRFDQDVIDAIKMRDEAKKALVARLRSVEFSGGPLCEKFLNGMSIRELSALDSFKDHFEKKLSEKKAVAAEANKVVDYALAAASTKEASNKIEPVEIKW